MNYLSSRYLLWGFLVVALVGVLGTTFWSRLGTWPRQGSSDPMPLEGLRSFGVVPDFSLIERSGKPIKLSDLHGKITDRFSMVLNTNFQRRCNGLPGANNTGSDPKQDQDRQKL